MQDERGSEKIAYLKPGIIKITFRYNSQSLSCKQEKLRTFYNNEHLSVRPLSFWGQVDLPLVISMCCIVYYIET